MRTKNKVYALLLGTFLLLIAACNKGEDNFLYKEEVLVVNLIGYNGSDEDLEVKIDTFSFKYPIPSQQTIDQSDAFTLTGSQARAKLTVTEKNTGKIVLERGVEKSEKIVTVNLFYTNDGIAPYNPPSVNPNTNIVGLFITKNQQPITTADIAITLSGNVIRFLAKDVPPNQWFFFETDYIPAVPATERILFRQAGTTLGYYQNSTGRNIFSNFPLFPIDGTKGTLRSYIITGSTGIKNIAATKVF